MAKKCCGVGLDERLRSKKVIDIKDNMEMSSFHFARVSVVRGVHERWKTDATLEDERSSSPPPPTPWYDPS